jgi:hypothetical protein
MEKNHKTFALALDEVLAKTMMLSLVRLLAEMAVHQRQDHLLVENVNLEVVKDARLLRNPVEIARVELNKLAVA